MYGNTAPFIWQQVGTVLNVTSSARAVWTAPIGLTYEQLKFVMTNITLAQVTNIELKINGAVFASFASGTELEKFNSYFDKQYTTVAGTLHFDFRRLGARLLGEQYRTVIGTGMPDPNNPNAIVASTFTVEFTLASGLSSPAIVPYAKWRDKSPLGSITQIKSFTYTPAGTGWYEISDLPRGQVIPAIILDTTSCTITEAQLKVDGQTLFEGLLAMHNSEQNDGVRRTQTNWFVVDADPNGEGAVVAGQGWWDMRNASDFRLRLNVSSAGALRVIVPTIAPLSR